MLLFPKIKTVVAFAVSTIITFLLASISHTQFVLAELVSLDIPVTSSIRLEASLNDIYGLLPGYGTVIMLGLMIAFTVTHVIGRKLADNEIAWPWWSFSAGLALFTALILMKPLLDVTPIAGARSTMGFLFQCLAGLIGGALFALLKQQKSNINSRKVENG